MEGQQWTGTRFLFLLLLFIYLFIIIGNFPGIVSTSAAAAYLEKEEEEEVGGGWDRGLKWYTTVDYFLRSRCYDFVICTYTRAYFALDECHWPFFFSCLSLEIIFLAMMTKCAQLAVWNRRIDQVIMARRRRRRRTFHHARNCCRFFSSSSLDEINLIRNKGTLDSGGVLFLVCRFCGENNINSFFSPSCCLLSEKWTQPAKRVERNNLVDH